MMITLNLPPEWIDRLEKAVEMYAKNLSRYINKSLDDFREIEIYQLILDEIRKEKLSQ